MYSKHWLWKGCCIKGLSPSLKKHESCLSVTMSRDVEAHLRSAVDAFAADQRVRS
jgi:hypothetical protein